MPYAKFQRERVLAIHSKKDPFGSVFFLYIFFFISVGIGFDNGREAEKGLKENPIR